MQNNNKNQENLIKLKRLEGKRVDFSTKLEELRVEHNKDMIFLHSNYTKQRNEVINKYETKRNNTKNQLDKTEAEIVKLLEVLESENNGILTNEVLGNLLSVVETPKFSLEDPDTEEEAMDNLLNEMQGLLEDH